MFTKLPFTLPKTDENDEPHYNWYKACRFFNSGFLVSIFVVYHYISTAADNSVCELYERIKLKHNLINSFSA